MNPANLLYAETHEWVHVDNKDGKKIATVGLTAHAIEALTDLVFMDLPSVGTIVSAGSSFGEVESVKATSDLYSPVDGEVIEVNSTLPDNLDVLSTDPYGNGWIIKVKVSDHQSLSKLMDLQSYERMCNESH
jgi:glycine cleavage system H protein